MTRADRRQSRRRCRWHRRANRGRRPFSGLLGTLRLPDGHNWLPYDADDRPTVVRIGVALQRGDMREARRLVLEGLKADND